jgi:hypothetical protein
MTSLTVRLPKDLRADVENLSNDEHKAVSEALLVEVRLERIGETRIVTPGVFARLQSEGPAEHRTRRSR